MHQTQNKLSIELQETALEVARFFSDRGDVLLVFVFGSVAEGKASSMSDVDAAVLFSQPPDAFEANILRDDLSARLKKEVDLAVLNEASPILKMQVLRKGILVFKRDAAAYNSFFVDTLNQYDDLKQVRKIIEENILKGRVYAR